MIQSHSHKFLLDDDLDAAGPEVFSPGPIGRKARLLRVGGAFRLRHPGLLSLSGITVLTHQP